MGEEEDREKVEVGCFLLLLLLLFFVSVNNRFPVPSFKYVEGSLGEPNEGAGGEEETFAFFLVIQE